MGACAPPLGGGGGGGGGGAARSALLSGEKAESIRLWPPSWEDASLAAGSSSLAAGGGAGGRVGAGRRFGGWRGRYGLQVGFAVRRRQLGRRFWWPGGDELLRFPFFIRVVGGGNQCCKTTPGAMLDPNRRLARDAPDLSLGNLALIQIYFSKKNRHPGVPFRVDELLPPNAGFA